MKKYFKIFVIFKLNTLIMEYFEFQEAAAVDSEDVVVPEVVAVSSIWLLFIWNEINSIKYLRECIIKFNQSNSIFSFSFLGRGGGGKTRY